MLGFLDEAEGQTTDFYRLALITQLRARLIAMETK
jgi:DNA-directed RNA polymerase subunit K/omega